MLPPTNQLPTHRIQKKLHDGLLPSHIALWFASKTIAQQLNSYRGKTPEELIDKMCCNMTINLEEKHEILDKMLSNGPWRGYEHFCKCLQPKDVQDVTDFL